MTRPRYLYQIVKKRFSQLPHVANKSYLAKDFESFRNDFTVTGRYNTALAQLGFIVVSMGHRGGSPMRSKYYHTFGYQNLRDYALADDKRSLEQLAERHSWIDLDNVDSHRDDLRIRGRAKGGATFTRGEGIFYSNGITVFTATNGGRNKAGQIWKYTQNKFDDNGVIELLYQSQDTDVLNLPDNIIIAPNGDILLCEDNRGRDRIVGIKSNGRIYYLASNALNNSEFAGLTFSPNGEILFVNIYDPSYTLAIKGPWDLL